MDYLEFQMSLIDKFRSSDFYMYYFILDTFKVNKKYIKKEEHEGEMLKLCPTCQEYKCIWEFAINTKNPDLHDDECAFCKLYPKPKNEFKKCSHCGAVKPLNEFYRSVTSDGGFRYFCQCKKCSNERSKASYIKRTAKKAKKKQPKMTATDILRTRVLKRFNKEVYRNDL